MQVWSRQRGVSFCPRHAPLARVAAARHDRGFTLVELMITLAVAVVLIMIAVPSFKTLTLSNKLTTTANDIVGALNIARMEAIKRNASTQLCSNSATNNTSDTLGTACGTQIGAVYVLVGATATATATQVGAGTVGITTPLALTGNMAAVRFDGRGMGHAPGITTPLTVLIADISTSAVSSNNHRCINLTAGSILVTTTTSLACP